VRFYYFFTVFFLTLSDPLFSQESSVNNGAYLVTVGGCANCHTRSFGGGYRLSTPFGDFITPNLTPDDAMGIGRWTLTDFRRALRLGVSPNGSPYYPAFPYTSFTKMSDSDMDAVFLYLRSLPPVKRQNKPNRLKFPFEMRWLLYFWQELFFKSATQANFDINLKDRIGPFIPAPNQSISWNRGAYLTEALLHCSECHTPRGRFGERRADLWMAGSDLQFEGRSPPNLTPEATTGLASWTQEDWNRFLTSGFTPEFSSVGSEMALVVRDTAALADSDRAAVIEYLMSLKPVQRVSGAGVGDE
jgi:mono/diheme cytochrome c family protein